MRPATRPKPKRGGAPPRAGTDGQRSKPLDDLSAAKRLVFDIVRG